MLNVELTEPQAEFYQSTAKATAAVAGFGSGKTQATVYRMISTMIDYPGANMLYAAPTLPLIKDILYDKLAETLPEIGIAYHINKADNIVYLKGLGQIFCRSMDNPDRIVGFEVLDAFADELDILNTDKALNVYRKIKARLRQIVKHPSTNIPKLNQMYVTTTPEGFKATYELFKKNPAPSSHLVQMTTYSNQHNLPPDYIHDLRENYPPQLIDAYLLGEFVNLVSKPVWSSYDTEANHVTNLQLRKGETLHIGEDFNVGRGCAVVYVERLLPPNHPFTPIQYKENARPFPILCASGEVYNTYDTPDTIRALQENFPMKRFPRQIVYPDATGKSRKSVNATTSDIALLKSAGYKILKRNRNPTIKDRVNSSNAAFCNANNVRRVFVDRERCPHFSEALTQQVYDDNGIPKKGDGMGDDITDAGTYPIYYHHPLAFTKMHEERLGGV